MKKMRKFLISALALFWCIIAYGWLTLIVAIGIIIVGAIVIYKLIRLIHQVLPPTNPDGSTNNTSHAQVWYQYDPPRGTSWLASANSVIKSTTNSPPATNTFLVQYTIPFTNAIPLMLAQFTTNTSISPNGNQYTLEDDDQYYIISTTYGGVTLTFDMDVVNNILLDYITNAPSTGIIEYTCDLRNWTPVFTNSNLGFDTIETYTDSIPSGLPQRFYRLKFYCSPDWSPPIYDDSTTNAN
jgi:hypothetical protein